MNFRTLAAGLRNPASVPRYLLRRIGPGSAPHRVPFHEDTVTTSIDFPGFAKELYLDVDLLERGLAGIDSRRSLEVGCGYGRLTPWIQRHSDEHHGIDAEHSLVRLAERHHPSGSFQTARAQTLPFDANQFELTVTWAVLMHIPSADIDRTAAEIRRVTDPNGAIIISEQVHDPAVDEPFVRPVEAYRRLFEPRQLVDVHHRSMEEPHWDDDHQHGLLRFE